MLVAISHEGGTRADARGGPRLRRARRGSSPARPRARSRRRSTTSSSRRPAIEESYCHTVSYTCAVAAGRALQGEDVSRLAADVFRELDAEPLGASEHDRFVVAGAGRDRRPSLEAVLKLREGAHVAAEAHHTEQLLHGHLAAIDPSVRCFVLEGEGRAAERAVDAMRALGRARLRCAARADDASGRRHRALPAPDVRSRGGARHRPGHDPLGRGAVGPRTAGPGLGQRRGGFLARPAAESGLAAAPSDQRAGRRSAAPASARRSSSSCCRRARARGRSPAPPRTSRSPSIFAAFFGHAIQSPSAGSSVAFSESKRRSSSSRVVVKKTTTPAPGFAPSFCESGVPE